MTEAGLSVTAELAGRVLAACRGAGIMLATAESCTGGLAAAALTDIAGSSDVVDRGFVTYSDAAKTEMLGVSPITLASHGAVSGETAAEMATGAIAQSAAGIAVSITGIAGPDGGSELKPVGLVWFGIALRGQAPTAHERRFTGSRAQVRAQAVETALTLIQQAVVQVGLP